MCVYTGMEHIECKMCVYTGMAHIACKSEKTQLSARILSSAHADDIHTYTHILLSAYADDIHIY